MLNHDFWIL